jgi:hypothetical protein
MVLSNEVYFMQKQVFSVMSDIFQKKNKKKYQNPPNFRPFAFLKKRLYLYEITENPVAIFTFMHHFVQFIEPKESKRS